MTASPYPPRREGPPVTNGERADDAEACLLLERGAAATLPDIVDLVTNLLHLAYLRNLSNSDAILHAAQMRFIDELDQEDRKDGP